jgi:N-acylglucosamine 2-epimerase
MFEQYIERYRRELFESVVPFWLRHSIDHEYGGYFTCLDRAGAIYDTRKYIWLQGRAIWMFSKLYNEVEPRQEWLDAAAGGLSFLQQHAFDAQGRCYFSLTREGQPASFQRKPYGAVFVAAGMLEYAKAVGGSKLRQDGIDLVGKIRTWIADPGLLGRPDFAGQAGTSKLADVMVMMMLLLEILSVDESPQYLDMLADYIKAAMKHHELRRNIFLEQVGVNGAFLFDSPDERLVNPGHSIEMAWFLLLALRRLPNPSMQKDVLGILASSLEFGWDQQYGGLNYFMDIESRPVLALESTMKLWWPHTEALYAVILAYTLTRDNYWLEWLERLDTYSFKHFADSKYGEWFGYCDREGNRSSECKGNNYKGFFHVPRSLLMSIQEMKAFEGRR